jgi:hypothetical protein
MKKLAIQLIFEPTSLILSPHFFFTDNNNNVPFGGLQS